MTVREQRAKEIVQAVKDWLDDHPCEHWPDGTLKWREDDEWDDLRERILEVLP